MWYLRLLPLLITACLLLGIAGCGGGSSDTLAFGGVSGSIYYTTETPDGTRAMEGAEVRVQGATLSTLTNADGFFSLPNVPAGTQTLVVSHPGYATIAVPVKIIAGSVVTIADGILQPISRKWTVLVFMNGDNDLETFGVQDMNELEAVPDSDEVAVLVQFDRSPGYDSSNGNWTGTKRYQVRHDDDPATITSPVLEDMGEVDMGKPEALREFIAWGKQLYPAERYLVIIWNHGAGWRTAALPEAVTRGVSFDDTSGTYISTTNLPAALQTSPPLDLVSFDSSLMQMMEVAYEMRHTCRYIVGSEESPPGAGYAYHTWLQPLVENPSMTPRELAETMARETLEYYGTSSNITHSVLDTGELEGLAQAVDTFAGALISAADSHAAPLAAARDEAERFAYYDNKDLYHYAQLVKAKVNHSAVKNAADGVMQAVERAVVAEYHGNYHPNAHGVAIFVGSQSTYARLASQYLPLALAKDTRWNEWLHAQEQ